MLIHSKATRLISVVLTSLLLLSPSVGKADQCVSTERTISTSFGSPCKQDPACVVIGGTHMLEWKSSAPSRIVVVCIHGLGLCARAYKPLAQELSAAGIDGFGVNVRGFGPDREQSDRAKLNCLQTVEDVNTLLQALRRERPDYRIVLIGESLGGALTMRIAAENPELVDAIVCSAPAWKVLKRRRTTVKAVFESMLSRRDQPGPASRSIIRQATSNQQLARHWLTDPEHKLKLKWREAVAFLNCISKTNFYAHQLTKPVLVMQGLHDRLVSPKGVAKMFNNIPSSNKTFLIDATGEHLLLEEAQFTPALTKKLIGWLKSDSLCSASEPTLEVIDDYKLSTKEHRKICKLLRLAITNTRLKDDHVTDKHAADG